jgi:pimeloyl-ACP methyl ester carboxylesterase
MSRILALLGTLVTCPACCSAEESPELCRSASCPMRYYLARPAKVERGCPVLIALAGAGADFASHARRFLRARGNRAVVLVVPCTFTSANRIAGLTQERFRKYYDKDLINRVGGGLIPDVRARLSWDESGVLAIIRDLRVRGMDGDVHVTGFSAGGMLAWWLALKHPDTFASVVPVCSNWPFWMIGRSDTVDSPARREVRIHAISGERDPLRPSRVGLPMPPTGATLAVAALLGVAAGCARRRGWSGRCIAVFVSLGVIVVFGLVAGRWSGNGVQTACAVELLRELGYSRMEWTMEPGMEHEPAAAKVFEWVAGCWEVP